MRELEQTSSTNCILIGGSWRGGPNPMSQEIVFFQIPAQIPQSQPVLLKLESHSHFSIVFFFVNPSPSAQNPISQPLKKANPSSHFTPSRPSTFNRKVKYWWLQEAFRFANRFKQFCLGVSCEYWFEFTRLPFVYSTLILTLQDKDCFKQP